MRSLKPFLNSLRFKLFAIIVLIIVPLVTLLIINNVYAVRVVRNEVSQTNKNLLNLYMSQIDGNLTQVDNYLYNLSQIDTDLLDLEKSSIVFENDYMKAKLRLYHSISTEISYLKSIDLLFIYSATNDDLMYNQNSGSYEEREELKKAILQLVKGGTSEYDNTHWYVRQAGSKYYLFHVIKTGNVFVGAWVNAEKIIIPLKLIDFGKSGTAFLATDKLEPMNHADIVKEHKVDLKVTSDPYYLSGDKNQYLVMDEPSSKGRFNLVALIPDDVILEKLPYLQRISSVVSVVACSFLLVFLFFMRKVFLLPITRIVNAMRKLRAGNWESRLQQTPTSTEFEIMNENFNHMITEIRDLKINVYEEKLNHQRAELKHLQLQINPHFFLNSLNIIYNLATVKDYALIQEMSKYLVTYFRFMFRSNSNFVSLKDELKHTENYLRIQQLRFPDNLMYRIDAPDELLAHEIPPLVIQTIAENCIKHAVTLDEPIQIIVSVKLDEDLHEPCLRICIEDTGSGFDEAVLHELQTNQEVINEEGEHIGLWNVRRRLNLLYPNQVKMDFYNASTRGAIVELSIPIKTK
jgi:two-component system sensor histidine kinase YesM